MEAVTDRALSGTAPMRIRRRAKKSVVFVALREMSKLGM
jgi:hypothetical protein